MQVIRWAFRLEHLRAEIAAAGVAGVVQSPTNGDGPGVVREAVG